MVAFMALAFPQRKNQRKPMETPLVHTAVAAKATPRFHVPQRRGLIKFT